MIIDENVVKVNTLLSDSTYNSLLAALVESSDDAIISKTPDGIITSWNVAAERMFGYSAKEILGKPISILVPKDSQEEFSLILEKIKKDQRIEHFETKRLNKDGKILNVSVTLSPIKNKEGKIIGISKIVRNITERKQSEQERIKLASIVESSEDAILGMNLDGIIDSWNSGAVKMFGYKENEIIGKSVQLIYPSERTEELPSIIQKLRSGARIEHFETERKRKDESIIDVSLSISPIKNEKGSIVGIAKIIRDISGQKRTSAYARSLIEASLDPLVTISLEGKITDVNDATVKVTGITRDKLIGTDFSNYFTEPDNARDGYERVFNKGFVTDYPLSIRHASGQITDVLYNASVYKDDKGNVLGVFAAARDVTETKKVSQYARSLIEASLDPLVTISPEGKITDVNDATVKVTGITRDKLIGTDFSNYFTEPDDALDGYERVFKEGFVTDYPLSIRHASGQITDVLYNASVYKDDKGNVLGVFAAARDVTRTKKAEEQLHATSAYARSLIEASLDPLVTISPEGKITDVNDATVKVTGVTREWLIGTDFSNYFTEQRRARDGYRLTFKEGSVKDYPLTIRHSSGKTTDVLYNASVYKDDKGNARGVFAAARDVTETKKVSQYARSLIEASLDPLVTISPEGKITDVNDATVKVTGVTRDKLIGTDFSNYFTKPDDARKGYERVFNKGFVTDYPLSIRHASGQITDVLYNASVYKDDKGNVLGVFAAARDATQVKQKDEFSAMVGHELKTPLVPILGYSELLLSGDMGKLTETQHNSVKTIFDNATRLLRLIQDILDVRKTELGKLNLDIRDVNAKEIIAQCLTAFKTTSQSKEITLVDNSQDIPLQCDFERIIQVINNLLSNAFKFTPQKYGKIEVGAKIDNDSVIFSVKDNGIGIPKEKQANLFKKFYQVDTSIKRSALGSGLGLAICRGIIESHKGKIWLESEAEKGTIVYFSILRKMT